MHASNPADERAALVSLSRLPPVSKAKGPGLSNELPFRSAMLLWCARGGATGNCVSVLYDERLPLPSEGADTCETVAGQRYVAMFLHALLGHTGLGRTSVCLWAGVKVLVQQWSSAWVQHLDEVRMGPRGYGDARRLHHHCTVSRVETSLPFVSGFLRLCFMLGEHPGDSGSGQLSFSTACVADSPPPPP